MPMHDWTTVPDGIFHAFHHRWISALSDDLNSGRLPDEYYALPEQVAAGLGPDVLTLQDRSAGGDPGGVATRAGTATARQSQPKTRFIAETEGEFYRRKKKSIAVRQVSGDRVVAVLEVVSPGNKSTGHAFQALVNKALELLEHRVHLMIIDPFPAGRHDPDGIHGAIWEEIGGEPFHPPRDETLTAVSYECDSMTRAYIEPLGVGSLLPEMPLFLQAGFSVSVCLESSYQTAFELMPRRWRETITRDAVP